MVTPALRVTGLAGAYGGRVVLQELDFEQQPGGLLGVIGPNGAGKSTLLKLLAGVLPPHHGEVELLGRPLSRLSRREIASSLAVVPAEVRSVFDFTAEEMVWMGRHPHLGLLGEPRRADHQAVDQALEQTGTGAFRSRRFGELSSGERQRVVLAQALAQQPRVLLLDEPTTHLDLAHAVRFLDLLRQLVSSQGLAAVLVSHDLNLASEYADRLALLDAGRLRSLGTPAEVLDYRLIEEAYRTVVVVKTNPISGRPHVVPVSRWSLDKQPEGAERDDTSA
jgi:iron complex transport system ATP-binding protein